MAEITAKLKRLDIAPRKVRAVIRVIAGLPVGDAEAQLLFRKERSARPILKLLRSAVANARNKNVPVQGLYVKAIWADEGPVMKRWLPRARGMATPLHKKFSHVTIVLAEDAGKKGRFAISEAVKAKKPEKKPAKKKAVKEEKKESPKAENKTVKEPRRPASGGVDGGKSEKAGASKADNSIKRMFRRKSV
jgi:large subunit ribosomal protein L22